MKKREIPRKNYVIVFLFCLFTILGTLYLKQVYENGNVFNEEKSVLMSVTSVLNPQEFFNYIQENGDILLYYSERYPLFEENFASYIREKELKNVVYIENTKDKEFLSRLQSDYSNKDIFSLDNVKSTSFLFLFAEGTIFDFLEINSNTTIEQVDTFLEKNKSVL